MHYRRHHASIVITVATVVAVCSVGVFAQQSSNKVRIQATLKPAEVADFKNPVEREMAHSYNPALKLTVNPQLQLDAEAIRRYERMASIINGSKIVPNNRLEYYGAFKKQNVFVIKGWVGFVQNVESDGTDGFIVSVRLTPKLESTNYGLNSIVTDTNSYETYHIINNNCSYIKSFDPSGLSGQMPGIIQL